MVDLKVKLVSDTAIMPKYSNPTDACMDLYADLLGQGIMSPVEIAPGDKYKFHVGIATEIPEGYYASVFPRSGLSIKEGLRLANLTGIIDSTYRNEWIVCLHNDSKETRVVKHGDRIAQFNILPVLNVNVIQVDELDMKNNRGGGIGHTGKQ